MKKIFFALVLLATFSVAANAQQGTKQISAGVELGLPTGTFGDVAKVGFGVNGKVIFGINDNGNITATTGFSNFGYKGYNSSNVSVIPVLGGYRHNFAGSVKGLYAEPQIGIGIYLSKFGTGSYKTTESDVNFTWALGGGYVYQNFDFGLRYQRAQAQGGGAGFFALKVAYNLPLAEEKILQRVLQLVSEDFKMMSGVHHVIDLFHSLQFKIGIASSSPQQMIDVVMDLCNIRQYVKATASAQHLPYGKPHPQVYLDCAESLASSPTSCLAFEDSFYGMIAAKAARMKCVVVPEHKMYKQERWGAADLKLSLLQNFNALHLQLLQ